MLQRPRRNRKSESIRQLVQETHVSVHDFVYPLFLVPGTGVKEKVPSLPIAYRMSEDQILKEIESCLAIGIHAFMLFPKIKDEHKDATGTYSYDQNNYYLKVAKNIKKQFPDITLISDVALDPYSSDGHDGIVKNGIIDNDLSLDVLDKMSLVQADAGFDIIGPSDMMDGRVGRIREALDSAGFSNTSIMSYTAKYASGFYGPFRDALDSAPVIGNHIPKDKKTYQMNPANKQEALIEAFLDTDEGADFLMVKPATNYLDIIHLLKENSALPIAAYQVSGECAMLIAAAEKKWLDFNIVVPESIMSIKRAGADIIISYFAKWYAEQLSNNH